MVQTGITRAYGAGLRMWIGKGMSNPAKSLVAGVGVSVLLQSSTATAILMASFASRGIVETAPALAVLLGGDIGTTLVVQAMTFRLNWIAPFFLLVGVVLYRNSTVLERQELGRALTGLGLMLFALGHIVSTSQPLRDSGVLPLLLPSLGGDSMILVVIGALLAWLAHSSLAMVLLIISLTSSGVLPLSMAFVLVLGVNIGGVLPALVATFGKPPAARRLCFGNLFFKTVGVVVCLPLLGPVGELIAMINPDPARQVANLHTAFNLALAAVFLFLTPTVARLMERMLPEEPRMESQDSPHFLDLNQIQTPSVAIALAEQETLRMADMVGSMLRPLIEVLRSDSRRLISEVEEQDNRVDNLNEAIKLYLTRVSREPMSEKDGRRIIEIITFATNLEHIGDIIDKNLMELATKKIRKTLHFSDEGMRDILELHERLMETFALGASVFMTGNLDMARKLLGEKTRFRDLERQATERHIERLRSGKIESIDSSSIHLDILRDLKRINSHVTAVVYPILDQAGQLWSSRLKKLG